MSSFKCTYKNAYIDKYGLSEITVTGGMQNFLFIKKKKNSSKKKKGD